MKKILFIGVLAMLISNLFALKLINAGSSIQIELADLESREQITYQTKIIKNDQPKNDDWRGIDLISLLEENEIKDYAQLKFYSEDNYMVRLSRAEIYANKPLIALERNGEKLPPEKIRLVVKNMRDMYWISDIAFVETESAFQLQLPRIIIFAEKIFQGLERVELPPFKAASGYKFPALISSVFPPSAPFYISGRDGVSHIYSYEEYLSEAVLIESDGKYDLKSVQMPGGMWIDDIAIIVVGETAIVFQNQFDNSRQIAELLGFGEYPAQLKARSKDATEILDVATPFAAEAWANIIKFSW
ncbi:MAG: hypothetical protein R6U84_08560 [Candidatus Cloacimonadales bacterium]